MFIQSDEKKASAEVELTPELLRGIGATHARFAIALAFLNKHGHLGKAAQVSMLPVEVGFRDVERWLSPTPDASVSIEDVFKSFDAKAQASDLRNAPAIVYAFTLKESADASRAVLKLRVVEGFASDPAHSALELDLASTGYTERGGRKWKATAWRVK